MDFTYTDEQQAIRDLADQILGDQVTPAALRTMEQGDAWWADDVWAALATADLLGIALPEAHGGGGYGLQAACLVLEQIGRRVAPLPYLTTIVGGALPIAEFGSLAQRQAFLPGVADGSIRLSIALYETGDPGLPRVPATQAVPDGDGWRLSGGKALVVGADRAARVLIPARTGEGSVGVFLVDPHAPGITLEREVAVNGEPQFGMELVDVAVTTEDLLGDPDQGAAILAWTHDRLTAGICAVQTGVCEEALAITARYVSEREQFGAKLGTFQAVGQRVADAYIDTEAIRLTALQAIWRLDAGLDATEELLTAKFWAADGAQRVVHAAQHLHGGIGMDLDYPIHRYFRWAKVLELTLGGATPSLRDLGARLAGASTGP
jgi:alkylation response protein AidB-like acyl-CoA dehydrogenase